MKKYIISAVVCLVFCNTLSAAGTPDGKALYSKYCVTCHAENVAPALKSPMVHDVKEWSARIKAAKTVAEQAGNGKTAMDVLIQTVKEGKGAMPPKGLCQDCTDEDYKAIIEFMSSKE